MYELVEAGYFDSHCLRRCIIAHDSTGEQRATPLIPIGTASLRSG